MYPSLRYVRDNVFVPYDHYMLYIVYVVYSCFDVQETLLRWCDAVRFSVATTCSRFQFSAAYRPCPV